jgi:hypothetical protein
VLQSYSGKVESGGAGDWDFKIDWGLFFGTHGKIFFDVYGVDAGKKVITIAGSYSSGNPSHELGGTGWLTERYFIVPFGDPNDRFMICEFSGRRGLEGVKP